MLLRPADAHLSFFTLPRVSIEHRDRVTGLGRRFADGTLQAISVEATMSGATD